MSQIVSQNVISRCAADLREWFRLEGVEWGETEEVPPAEEQFVRSVLVAAGLGVPEVPEYAAGERCDARGAVGMVPAPESAWARCSWHTGHDGPHSYQLKATRGAWSGVDSVARMEMLARIVATVDGLDRDGISRVLRAAALVMGIRLADVGSCECASISAAEEHRAEEHCQNEATDAEHG